MELTKEHFELIPKIDISTPEKLAQFKAWQNNDGTIEGLRKLYEAQQSVNPTLLTARQKSVTCPQCGCVHGVDLPASQSG